MRDNQQVTQNEYVVRDGALIVSATDLDGRIVLVSPEFIQVSGFSEEELMGKNHGLLRHPDIPAAYAAQWAIGTALVPIVFGIAALLGAANVHNSARHSCVPTGFKIASAAAAYSEAIDTAAGDQRDPRRRDRRAARSDARDAPPPCAPLPP